MPKDLPLLKFANGEKVPADLVVIRGVKRGYYVTKPDGVLERVYPTKTLYERTLKFVDGRNIPPTAVVRKEGRKYLMEVEGGQEVQVYTRGALKSKRNNSKQYRRLKFANGEFVPQELEVQVINNKRYVTLPDGNTVQVYTFNGPANPLRENVKKSKNNTIEEVSINQTTSNSNQDILLPIHDDLSIPTFENTDEELEQTSSGFYSNSLRSSPLMFSNQLPSDLLPNDDNDDVEELGYVLPLLAKDN